MPALDNPLDPFETPSDCMVSLRKLDDAVAERTDPDHWVVRPGTVSDEVEQVPAWRRLVRDGPEVTEIPPDVHQLVAINRVTLVVANELKVRANGPAELFDRGFWR